MNTWISESIFYHIYPLGLCGSPQANDFSSPPVTCLEQLYPWLDHIQSIGANALYLGPLFESGSHGYDTADYFQVDRRLGTNETLAQFSRALHQRGMRLILDGVFNHTGRDFWAFRDLRSNLQASPYRDWYRGVRFNQPNTHGDPFTYETWNGYHSLPQLNLSNPDVRQHLLQAVEMWVNEFDIDGLRLDAADCLDFDFMAELSSFSRRLRTGFWLMGEVIHGDYRRWANPGMLDSVTNYECYKGLYSSHVDQNYFEIAYALNRQYGAEGIYRDLLLYNFADNHDVNRVASNLTNAAHLYPLQILLFSIPGVPSIYYGSEWGLAGMKTPHSDAPLRPAIDLGKIALNAPAPDLPAAIARLARIRQQSPALQRGDYTQLHVAHQQLAFTRQVQGERVVVAVNAAETTVSLNLTLPEGCGTALVDLLNPGERFDILNGQCTVSLPACWGRIFICAE